MINFICGSYGSGKTTKVFEGIKESTSKHIKTFLIVPDQEALQFERASLSYLPDSAQLYLEILSFSRLYNRVCREIGGLSYSYITPPIQTLLMWKALRDFESSKDKPLFYKNLSENIDSCDMMISTINELKSNGVSSSLLEEIAEMPHLDSLFVEKIKDLAVISSKYDALVKETYSDSADDLSKLSAFFEEKSKKSADVKAFFKNSDIYIDSFSSFTPVQHKIIEELFKCAKNVTITVPLSRDHSNYIKINSVINSYEKLLSSAKTLNPKHEFLEKNHRAKSPVLAYLAKNIWAIKVSKEKAPELDGSIVIETCDNPYSEAEAVSSHILELLRKGARCKDIAIIARDAEKYRGIIDLYLEKSNIPFFFGPKTDLCSFPSVKLMLLALKIKKNNWRKHDVIAYIKTGMCDISPRAANLFEEYVNTWNINGKKRFILKENEEWSMNADGFTEKKSVRGEHIRTVANEVRAKIVPPLEKLFIRLESASDVSQMCTVMYEYLNELNIEDQMRNLAKKISDINNQKNKDSEKAEFEKNTATKNAEAQTISPQAKQSIKRANEIARAYQATLNVLADIAEALQGRTADTEEFMNILRNTFTKAEIASIPTSIDEVTIGSASTMRVANPKYVFAIGLCEGEFPASVSDSTLLSESDRKIFEKINHKLSQNLSSRSSDELMYVQRAFSAPSKRLYASYHKKGVDGNSAFPSLAFSKIIQIFPKITNHVYIPSDFNYLIPAPKNAVSILNNISDEDTKDKVRSELGKHIPSFSDVFNRSVAIKECRVDTELVKKAIGNELKFAPTSFEKYVKCPFDYFCSKILYLREQKNSEFDYANIGDFVHNILEKIIKAVIPTDNPIKDEREIIKLTDAAISEYINKICPPEMLSSASLKHIYTRLRSLTLMIINNIVTEFSLSDFRPYFFEIKADGEEGRPEPLEFKLKDGTTVKFGGTIDRVDIYKKDDDVYIRVVDYKTGTKKFTLDDVEHGINLQMLIYLATLCKAKSKDFKKAIGDTKGKDAIPAGVVYLSTNINSADTFGNETEKDLFEKSEKNLKRSGLFLDEPDILNAMNKEGNTKFLPGTKPKKNEVDSRTSREKFNEIFDQIEKTVVELGNNLRDGIADAKPISYGSSPCQYCQSKAICKNVKQ